MIEVELIFVGFNCGEASNIATPEWLRFAKDAAIRRASINYPPMVSHFQLLYDLALAICSRCMLCVLIDFLFDNAASTMCFCSMNTIK